MTTGFAEEFTWLGRWGEGGDSETGEERDGEGGGAAGEEETLGKFYLLFQEQKIFSIASWLQRFFAFFHPEKIKPGPSAR